MFTVLLRPLLLYLPQDALALDPQTHWDEPHFQDSQTDTVCLLGSEGTKSPFKNLLLGLG